MRHILVEYARKEYCHKHVKLRLDEEIARITGIPSGTVKRHWATAKAFIKQQLDRQFNSASRKH